MRDNEYAFAVSAVRVRENGLLSKAQTEALIMAPDEAASLRLLEDSGYPGITADPDGVLADKIFEITDYVRDISPNGELLEFLLIKNDFHNIKAAMKCAVSELEPDGYFLPSVSVSEDTVKTAVLQRRFDLLPDLMKEYAIEAWSALTGSMNGQLTEAILDRGAIEVSVRIAEESGDTFSIGLAKLRRKTASLLIACRCAAAGKNNDFIRTALPCTEYKDSLVKAALSGTDEVMALAEKLGIATSDSASASDIVRSAAEAEEEYISRAAFVSMGTAPVIAYYLRAEREVSAIRILLSCKRCGLTDAECRRRL